MVDSTLERYQDAVPLEPEYVDQLDGSIAIDTGGAISVGAVNIVKDTARAAISAAQDAGAEAGSAAVAAVRDSIAAAREIGSDLGRRSGRVLNGTFEAAREMGKDLMDLGPGGAKRP